MASDWCLVNTRWMVLLISGATIASVQLGAANPVPSDNYVDSRICANCHAAIARGYESTGMANSFSTANVGNVFEGTVHAGSYDHAAAGIHYSMLERRGRYYQRRLQFDYQGKETNVEEKQIDFVLGSGRHSRTFLHLTNRGTLQELPLGWYAELGGHWGMNPGYDTRLQPGSQRTVTYECMFCHNGYPRIPPDHVQFGAEPAFEKPLPEGIDCQRCHGPGRQHLEAAETPGATLKEIRNSIVNPARLRGERQMEICMQCHLETTSGALPHSILRYDRAPFSYNAGEPLGNFMLFFEAASPDKDRFEIAHSAYRLRQSACFLKSAGTLTCTTCHDPHREDRRPARYNAICRRCHSGSFDTLVKEAKHTAASDCIGCHMPARRTDDVVHVVMTDHWIQRRKPERDQLAAIPVERESDADYRGEVVFYYPLPMPQTPENQLYLAIAQVRAWANLSGGLPQLQKLLDLNRPQRAEYYLELADGLRVAGERQAALKFYEEASRRQPASPLILRTWATNLMELANWSKAEEIARSVVRMAPDDAPAWYLLGQIYLAQQKTADAAASLRKSLEVNPEIAEACNSLGLILATTGDLSGAEREFREAIRLQPAFVEAYSGLANVLSWRHDVEQATYYFETAVRLRPSYATARLNYGLMLNELRRFVPAESEAQAAVDSDPNLAEGHELLGNLLERRGEIERARREYEAAVRIRPTYARAQLSLGAILARSGSAAAAEHLRAAQQSSDAAIRDMAHRILSQLGVVK
jgi:tetratricopeptide (TPR) repeat protein